MPEKICFAKVQKNTGTLIYHFPKTNVGSNLVLKAVRVSLSNPAHLCGPAFNKLRLTA